MDANGTMTCVMWQLQMDTWNVYVTFKPTSMDANGAVTELQSGGERASRLFDLSPQEWVQMGQQYDRSSSVERTSSLLEICN